MTVVTNATILREPVQESECGNCGVVGTMHVDGKCPFEASQFHATKFVDTPVLRWSFSPKDSASTASVIRLAFPSLAGTTSK